MGLFRMTAAKLTAPARRGSSKLQIWLSSDQTSEWTEDPKFRASLSRELGARAKARGRKFYEVFGAQGTSLHLGEVGSS
jgi:hypothetical protein